MKYETRSELLRAAADSIEMQEAAGVEPVCMCDGQQHLIKNAHFLTPTTKYEFPLAVVEGRQVWAGDTLWHKNYPIIQHFCVTKDMENWSWSPPKPATVLVELSVEDAKYWSNTAVGSRQLRAACRKALEEMK